MNSLLKEICAMLTEENTDASLGIKMEIENFILAKKTIDFEESPNSELKEDIVSLIEKSDHNLAEVLILAQKRLKWRKTTIPATLISDEISNLFYVCPIMGVDTVIPSREFRLGFLFQKPNSYYPLHSHNAEETYFIIGGELDWSDGNKKRKLVAGDTVNHSSLLPHSFETKSSGFLGLWHWSGDISAESYKILE